MSHKPTDLELQIGGSEGVDTSPYCALFDQYVRKELQDGAVERVLVDAKRDLLLNVDVGLDDAQCLEHRRLYGANEVPPRARKPYWKLLLEQLSDKILLILILCAVVSIPIGIGFEDPKTGWIDGTAILVAVVVVVLTGATTDWKKDKQFAELENAADNIDVFVRRNGHDSVKIPVADVVVGDVLVLSQGDSIVADGILVHSSDLKANESALTGESDMMSKEADSGLMVSGTTVGQGGGMMVVVAVGVKTYSNRLRGDIGATEIEATPLQLKLEGLATAISKLGLAGAVVGFTALMIRWLASSGWNEDGWEKEILEFVITAITILVVAIPEGLPLAVVIALAFSVKKMMKDMNLVRHLHACETMGSATNICSDKTGTLTQNKMSVRAAHFTKLCKPPTDIQSVGDQLQEILYQSFVLNSNSKTRVGTNDAGEQVREGNPTECALFELMISLGKKPEQMRHVASDSIVKEYPFDSAVKRMSVVIRLKNGTYRLLTKGAPEVVLRLCPNLVTGCKRKSGDVESDTLDDVHLGEIKRTQLEFSHQAYRVLGFAYKDFATLPKGIDVFPEEQMVHGLTFLGVVGIADPLREDVPEAVERCRDAGITVRMVTGDNIDTAIAIAKDAGILQRDAPNGGRVSAPILAMTGPDFRTRIKWHEEQEEKDGRVITSQHWDQDEFEKIGKKLRVLARSSPTDKYVLVSGLQAMGEIVAVTGDGTNDAFALKKADVGFAMGIAGTEVAKQASDIVIMDDNFSSIIKAVHWGRNVGDAIRKFLQFQLTVNVVAIVVAVIGAVGIEKSPLTTVQLLWVNLVMDAFASLALATEPPSPDQLERRPRHPDAGLISRIMLRNIIGHAVYQSVVIITLVFAGDKILDIPSGWHVDESVHLTLVFAVFVFMQIFNEINSRWLTNVSNPFEGFTRNTIFLAVFFGTFVVQVVMVEFGGKPMGCVSLITHDDAEWYHWLIVFALGGFSLVVGALLRMIPESALGVLPELEVHEMDYDEVSTSSLFHAVHRPYNLGRPSKQIRRFSAAARGLHAANKAANKWASQAGVEMKSAKAKANQYETVRPRTPSHSISISISSSDSRSPDTRL